MADTCIAVVFLMFIFPVSALAQSAGTVPAGSSLTADEASSPWLSPSGHFAFGFKQLQDHDKFLLSIWYHQIPEKTVVWYVDETMPRGSTIQLDAQFGLVLRNPLGQAVWRTDGIDNGTDHGFMNDTGNFVLKGSDYSWLWISFGHAADTLLPLQELVIGSVLNSRQSATSFSQGRFYVQFREDGQLVLASRSEDAVYYESKTFDSKNSSNSGYRVIFNRTGSMYIVKRNNQTQQLSPVSVPPASENYFRATLDFNGVFTLYSHPKNFTGNSTWNICWSVPDDICTALTEEKGSGPCGFNSICRLEESRPVCECPEGYNLVDSKDIFRGCKPNFTTTCGGELEQGSAADLFDFAVIDDLDWPRSDYEQINSTSETFCTQSCLQDCFCAAAVFLENSCSKMRLPLANGRLNSSFSSKAFIKYGKSYTSSHPGVSNPKDRGTLILVLSLLLGSSLFLNFALIGTICLGFYLIYQKKKVKLHQKAAEIETNLLLFSFKELTEATKNFNQELGSGSFGVVYKGEIASSSGNFTVAVKKLNRLAQEKEFRAEVNSIGQTNHKNLVRLLGFCDEGPHRLLVYEYISNGTLASFLFSDSKPSWDLRKQIALGIARGLVYLHEECSIQIIHCDIKPQNILLDDCYNVRISDFGLAKLLDINQSRASLTHVRGTKGYVAPEWFRNKQITAKVDVYSFGVLLLEIISCRNCVNKIGIVDEECDLPLTDLVWDCFQKGRLDAIVEDDSEALNDYSMLEKYVMVGIWCIQENASLRPAMRKVSQMLEGIMELQIPPCPYPFSYTD